MTEWFHSVRFDPESHDVAGFTSGEPALDQWLREHAASKDRRGHSRTFVWTDGAGRVVGYYTLSAHKVARESIPNRLGRGGPREIPATLIGKLALGSELRGRGLGVVLLADALERIIVAAEQVAAKLVVVDALREEVAGWYVSLGFQRVPGSLVLVLPIKDAAAARAQSPSGSPLSSD